MKKRSIVGLTALTWSLAAACAANPAAASSLPRVDFGDRPSVGLGIGANQSLQAGGSLSLDAPIASQLMLGGAISTSILGNLVYDVRAMYRIVEGVSGEGPSIAGMIGLWGAPGASNFQLPGQVAPLVGFGMAYAINEQFDVRLNLAYSPFFTYTSGEFLGFVGGPPGSGIEVGYQLLPNLEATLGINGRGDVLGLNMTF